MYGRKIDKDYILETIPMELIMEQYLGLPVNTKKMYKSPLRADQKPTCHYFYNRQGKLIFHDFSGHFSGDCFALVQFMYNCTFIEAIDIIASDFGLKNESFNKEAYTKQTFDRTPSTSSVIAIKRRAYTQEDANYWRSFGVGKNQINSYKVFACENVWVNGKIIYTTKKSDPAYAYYFGDEQFKVYFPKRDKYRFVSNCDKWQGWEQLPENGFICVITKSLKDVMVLNRMGVAAVAPHSESKTPEQERIQELRGRFTKVYSLYDFDLTGIRTANAMRKDYAITPLFLTNGRFGSIDYKAKDISDWVKVKGYEFVHRFVQELIPEKDVQTIQNQPREQRFFGGEPINYVPQTSPF